MKKPFVNTGKCIWCSRSCPEVTFFSEPHILPHSLGGDEIGVDVCDDCNHYFGKATRGVPVLIWLSRRYLVHSRRLGITLMSILTRSLALFFFNIGIANGKSLSRIASIQRLLQDNSNVVYMRCSSRNIML